MAKGSSYSPEHSEAVKLLGRIFFTGDRTFATEEETNIELSIDYKKARKGEVKDCTGNNTRAKSSLLWTPSTSVEEGIKQTLRWRGL